MLVSGLAFAAFTASTTLATPLLGSLKGSNSDVDLQKRPSPRFNRRDVNKAELAQLPTVNATALSCWPACLPSQQCRRDDLYELFTEPLNEPYVEEFCSIYIASSSLVRATYVPTYTSAVYVTAAPQITTTTDVP